MKDRTDDDLDLSRIEVVLSDWRRIAPNCLVTRFVEA